jgi:pimeloyl-ACP methyl ester carboxylesterase
MGIKILIFSFCVLALLTTGFFGLGMHKKPRSIQNFEEGEYGQKNPFVKPNLVKDGLAIYTVGSGEPVLLFPYPHAHTTTPMAQGPIAELLVDLGRTVVSFDVPGAYRSTREPVGDVGEMIRSAEESLDMLGIEGAVDVVGHSMGGLNALAFTIERPERTKRLVLIGSMSGFPAVLKWGMPWSKWHFYEADAWRLMLWGLQVKYGRGSLATHKKLQNLMTSASFHDKSYFTPLEIDSDDYDKGIPIREIIWGKNMERRVTYAERLGLVEAPTLIAAGRHDPEAPVVCSEELYQGIPQADLVIFEKSGHYPFIEEREYVSNTLADFLR